MISRVTLGLLLAALLIPSGVAVWTAGRRDACSQRDVRSEMVEVGGRMVEVSCAEWLPRQPMWVQVVCLLEGVVVFVMGVNVVGDWMEVRRVRRAGSARSA